MFNRDLKPENILLNENGEVKISDFGLSVFTTEGIFGAQESNIIFEGPNLNHTTCGTMSYLAPEVIKNKGYDG